MQERTLVRWARVGAATLCGPAAAARHPCGRQCKCPAAQQPAIHRSQPHNNRTHAIRTLMTSPAVPHFEHWDAQRRLRLLFVLSIQRPGGHVVQHLLEPVNDQIRHPSAGRDAGEGAGRGSGREQQQQLPDIGCSCPELVRRHGASPHGAAAGPARPAAGCLPACLWPRPFGWLLSSRQIQASEGGGWSFPAAAAAVAALRKQKTTAVGVCMFCQAGGRQQLFPAHTSLMQAMPLPLQCEQVPGSRAGTAPLLTRLRQIVPHQPPHAQPGQSVVLC